MKTINDYLDDAKAITGSDYKTAQYLEISRQYVSTWRRGQPMSDDICYRLAELLQVSPFEIMANQNAARAKDSEMRKAWEKLARSVAPALLLALGLVSASQDADAKAGVSQVDISSRYYAHMRITAGWPGGQL